HRDVDVGRRHHLVEVDVEAVGEHQHLALAEPAADRLLEDRALRLVGQQDHHHVAHLGGVGHRRHLQTILLGGRPRLAALVEADDDILTGVAEVQRVGVALAAVAHDRDLLALEEAEIGVLVVVDLRRHARVFLSLGDCQSANPTTRGSSETRGRLDGARFTRVFGPRVIAILPVRTTSWTPMGRSSSISASTLPSSPVASSTNDTGVTSMTRARKMSAVRKISARCCGSALTRISTSSRSTWLSSVRSLTLMTSISLWSCFITCSMMNSSPVTTMVMRETLGSSVSPTERLSML